MCTFDESLVYYFMRKRILLFCSCFQLFFSSTISIAQPKNVKSVQQVWLGYMSSTRVSNHYSWWNDIHYVPQGFFVARTGLTRHIKSVNVTAGYAFLLLPTYAGNSRLQRKEQRPWAEIFFTLPVNKSIQFIQRYRYEARFKENIKDSMVTDGYTFTNRARLFLGLRKNFTLSEGAKITPFILVADELLINFGNQVTYNTFDQNRILVSFGIQKGNTQYQVSYMNRFVQTGVSEFTENQMLCFWITQKFSWQKRKSTATIL